MANPNVAYAAPNYIARAAAAGPGFVPNDAGEAGAPGGWQQMQWNFLPCGSLCQPGSPALPFQARGGIGMPQAWQRLIDLQRPGGQGVTVAVLDTGVAYRPLGAKIAGSPDFDRSRFARGYDFVDRDKIPVDEDGHGTHIAGTIAEQTGNGTALTGIAYGATVMPVRVLDSGGLGRARDIGAGITWAAKHGAKIINLSFEFAKSVNRCSEVPTVCAGVRFANRRGALVVAAAGNDFRAPARFPARIEKVVGVGGATEGACIANYSNRGKGVDIFAPGGDGENRFTPCRTADRPIFQLTFTGNELKSFGYPSEYSGSSMAAAHVSGVAALVIASGVLGDAKAATPSRLRCQLAGTARKANLGQPYARRRWGAGLLDAAAAVTASPVC